MPTMTKQGVRDLGAGTAKQHTHRYVPDSYVSRNGIQVAQMKCFCGEVHKETDAERLHRENLERCDDYEPFP